MKFNYLFLIAVLTASRALAMQYGFDYTQRTYKTSPAIERKFNAETQRENQAVAILADAFGALPKNKQRSEKEKQDFKGKLRAGMPDDAQELIGQFLAKPNHAFINEHRMRLIPCVVEQHPWYQSMKELLDEAQARLNQHYQANRQRFTVRDQPYIVGAAGFWTFNDEPSRLRLKYGARNFSSDLRQWFGLHYPDTPVKALGDNEWVGVLYSDGKIRWQVSPLNTARLKNLSSDQLALCIAPWLSAFWKPSDVLPRDPEHRQAYHSLPAPMRKALHSNFKIALSFFEKYAHKGRQGAECAAIVLAAAYWGYKYGSAVKSLYSYMKIDKLKGVRKVLAMGGFGYIYTAGLLLVNWMPLAAAVLLYGKKTVRKTGRDILHPRGGTARMIQYFTHVLVPLIVVSTIGTLCPVLTIK